MNLVFLAALVGVGLAGDPEIGMRTPDLIKYWGYPVESVKAQTKDGYILTMHRIPHGKNDPNPTKRRPVVFCQHGLETSSSNFVTNLPQKSLGFLLADHGFDVWMGNVRGNVYSIGHTTLDISKHEYWKFSWSEMTHFDLTAMIDKALEITNQTELYYVGHSQGTMTMFAKLASEPAYAKKIKKFFALAPVATVSAIKGLVGVLARDFYYGFEFLEKILGENQFLPDNKLTQAIEKLLCTNPVTDGICDSILFLISGPESNQFNESRVPVYISDLPSGTSTMNILHWSQMVRSKNVQEFDWENNNENMKHYGQKTPPVYDFKKIIDVDIYLFWSDTDWLATKTDINEYLLPNLNPKVIKLNQFLYDFNHLDFLWGERARKEIYDPIIAILKADIQ